MPVNGTAFAKLANRFAAYAEGEVPFELVSCEPGAARVPFVHDGEKTLSRLLEPGALDLPTLHVMTRTLLATAAQYTHNGETWTVEAIGPDAMAGAEWPHFAVLVAHAR